MIQHHFTHNRQRTRHHTQAGLAAGGHENVGIFFPRRIFFGELRLDIASPQRLPASMIDLAQAITRNRREVMRPRDDGRRFGGALHRAAIHRCDVIICQANGQRLSLLTALVGQIDIDRPGEAIFGAVGRGVFRPIICWG